MTLIIVPLYAGICALIYAILTIRTILGFVFFGNLFNRRNHSGFCYPRLRLCDDRFSCDWSYEYAPKTNSFNSNFTY